MPRPSDIAIDAASALCLGQRARQEDALATSFSQGADVGFAVLSDGMGGHSAGDVASRIIVTEIFAELTLRLGAPDFKTVDIPGLLRGAARVANDCLRARISADPETEGMGGTLIVVVVLADQLYWISIGDSPLYLFRDGQLSQLNDDHSLAPQIDLMVTKGLIDAETARNHPQRNCLTSALIGEDIAAIDCPDEPFVLRDGDLVLAASDGLQFLPDEAIRAILDRATGAQSAAIANALVAGVTAVGDPEQDNLSVVVLKASDPYAEPHATTHPAPVGKRRAWTGAIAPMRALFAERSR